MKFDLFISEVAVWDMGFYPIGLVEGTLGKIWERLKLNMWLQNFLVICKDSGV